MSYFAICAMKPKRRALDPERGDSSAGFTLVEVVLALTIFALMGGILYGAFALGHGAVSKSEASSIRSQQMRTVSDLLAAYLRSAYPYRESAQQPAISFTGEIDSLSFVSAYSHGLGGRGMARVVISKEEEGSGQERLKLVESVPVGLGEDGGAGAHTHSLVLHEGVRDFRIEYLDGQSDPERWEERWDGKERAALPRAVRFTYRDAAGKEVRWTFPLMMAVLSR